MGYCAVKRLLSVVYRGKKGYQEALLKRLEAIKTHSEKLIQQAQNAHMMYTQLGISAIRTGKNLQDYIFQSLV
jgi:hypothetical protein